MGHKQLLNIEGHIFRIKYNFLDDWRSSTSFGIKNLVTVIYKPHKHMTEEEINQLFESKVEHLLFVIREYLSAVKDNYKGIRFEKYFKSKEVHFDVERRFVQTFYAELAYRRVYY
jgi:hypothetical protein